MGGVVFMVFSREMQEVLMSVLVAFGSWSSVRMVCQGVCGRVARGGMGWMSWSVAFR